MRVCTICTSENRKRLDIDRRLARGEGPNAIARATGRSRYAIARHRDRCAGLAVAVADQEPSAPAADDSWDAIVSDLSRLQVLCERRQDLRGSIVAIRERVAALRVKAEIEGKVRGSSVTVNVVNNEPLNQREELEDYLVSIGCPAALVTQVLAYLDRKPLVLEAGGVAQ